MLWCYQNITLEMISYDLNLYKNQANEDTYGIIAVKVEAPD